MDIDKVASLAANLASNNKLSEYKNSCAILLGFVSLLVNRCCLSLWFGAFFSEPETLSQI